jgi:hypothetical protein
MKLNALIVLMIVLVAVPTAGLAVRLEIPPSEDTYVSLVDSTTDFSAATILPVHATLGTTVMGLMKFDLSAIPVDAKINLAYLYVYDDNLPTADAPVYEATSAWTDNLVNWTNRPSLSATAAGKLDGYPAAGWFYANLTDLVRGWHEGTKSNHGVVISGGFLMPGKVERHFHSVENTTNPPKLMVIYDSDSVQILPEQDTYVSYDNPAENYGTSETLQIRKYGRWSYLQFDESSIPAGATIEYARLRMYEYAGTDFWESYAVGAHLVTEAWVETTLTWQSRPGNFPAPPYVKGSVGLSTAVGWIDLNVTSYVESWYAAPAGNNGVLVKYPYDGGSSSSGGVGSFRSREYGTVDQRPVLEVYYTAPPSNTFGTPVSLTAVNKSEAVWGDWDDDGDLDLAYCGDTGAGYVTLTYENVNGVLTERANSITGIVKEFAPGGLAFGDYDNDGDLDLAVAGQSDSGPFTGIYENDGSGNFTYDYDTSHSLYQLRYASLAWGDYDGDGDLDLYAQGNTGSVKVSILYENDPDATPRLQDSGVSLSQIYAGSAAWVDWDNDGDLDLAVTGSDYNHRFTIFYENTGSSLTAIPNGGLPNIVYGDLEWGDYDSDGDMDLAFMGETQNDGITYGRVYQNDGDGNLTHVWSADIGFRLGTCAWGDYDNDGKLDLAFCGYDTVGVIGTHIYHNDGVSGFSRHTASLQDVYYGSVSWADVDGDGDLDLFVNGRDLPGTYYAELYPNQSGVANTPPTAPNSFTTIRRDPLVPLADRKIYLQWAGASDAETTHRGLYYCVRVGTSPGGNDVFSGTYDSPLLGNVGEANRLEIKIPATEQHYYWAVRTIDSGLMASDWSVERCSWAPDSLYDDEDEPVDDAFVCSDTTWAGKKMGVMIPDLLSVGDFAYTGTVSRAYLMFNMSFLDSVQIRRAELYAHCISAVPSTNDVAVYGEMWDNWDENLIIWYNAPAAFHPYPWDIAPATAGQWSVWDVTKAVEAVVDNELTLVLVAYDPTEGTPNAVSEFDSKEFDYPPYLKITYATATGVDDAPILKTLILGQNYPNPFNPQTRVSYTIPDGSRAPVSIRIYDVAGRLVRSLVDEPQPAGVYTIDWDGTNDRGTRVASGVYFYRLRWKGEAHTKKMILLK